MPDGKYDWPLVKTSLFGRGRMADAPVYHTDHGALREGCATYKFDETLYSDPGTHSLTVTASCTPRPRSSRTSPSTAPGGSASRSQNHGNGEIASLNLYSPL